MADELAAVLAANAQRVREQAEERRRALLAEYGPDRFRRGEVLIFRPHLEEADQETRVAVKIGPDSWTLSARGGTRPWAEMLAFAGSGHRLMKSTNEVELTPVITVQEISE